VIEIRHDDHRTEHNKADDEDAKGERQEIVGLVRRARNMQKEDKMNAHPRDRQQDRYARCVDEAGRRRPERGEREDTA
jgi:hypothetical protein